MLQRVITHRILLNFIKVIYKHFSKMLKCSDAKLKVWKRLYVLCGFRSPLGLTFCQEPTTTSECGHFRPTDCSLNRQWDLCELAERGEKLVTGNLVVMSQLLDWGSPIRPVKHHLPANGIDFLCKYLPVIRLLDWSPYFPQNIKQIKFNIFAMNMFSKAIYKKIFNFGWP